MVEQTASGTSLQHSRQECVTSHIFELMREIPLNREKSGKFTHPHLIVQRLNAIVLRSQELPASSAAERRLGSASIALW